MWIPYDLEGPLKAECDAEVARQSRTDATVREFIVGFFVRNPVTRLPEIDLKAPPDGTEVVAALGDGAAQIMFHGNEAGKTTEVIYRLLSDSPDAALAVSHFDLQGRLDLYACRCGRGMEIAGWRVADPAHSARWRRIPFRPSALAVSFGDDSEMPADLRPFLALYRKARNAADVSLRLLCAYPIIREFVEGAEVFAASRAARQEPITVTRVMLVLSGAYDRNPEFEGCDLDDLLKLIEPTYMSVRTAVTDPALADAQAALGSPLPVLANLADMVARQLLSAELDERGVLAGKEDIALEMA